MHWQDALIVWLGTFFMLMCSALLVRASMEKRIAWLFAASAYGAFVAVSTLHLLWVAGA